MKGFNFLSDEQHQEEFNGRIYAWWFFAACWLHLHRVIGTAGFACLLGRGWDASFPKLVCQHLPKRLLSLIPNKSLTHKCCEDTWDIFSESQNVCMLWSWYTRQMPEGWYINFQPQTPDSQVSTMKRNKNKSKAKLNHTLRSKSTWKKLCQRRLPSHQDEKLLFYFKNWASWQGCKAVLVI